jgi:hypothetical protein
MVVYRRSLASEGMMRKTVIPVGMFVVSLILGPAAEASTIVQCTITAVDAYGVGAAGVGVDIGIIVPPYVQLPGGPVVAVTSGTTDAGGHVTLTQTRPDGFGWFCATRAGTSGYIPYPAEKVFQTFNPAINTYTDVLGLVPRPADTIQLAGGGTADLYRSANGYDKPVVVAQPFNSAETTAGRFTAADLWRQYNGDPRLLSQGGMLGHLYRSDYDIWLVRPRMTGDDLNHQAADFAQAIQMASTYASYNGKVTAAGYSLGGLVNRITMSKWSSYGYSSAPPVNLIVTLDAPLRGAIVSNDLQHAFWNVSTLGLSANGQQAHDRNMDSCGAQQMLENACHKLVNCDTCLECNDNGWYQTFYGGTPFTYCSPSQGDCYLPGYPYYGSGSGLKTCSGVALLNQPNGGWPVGIRKISASMGKFNERTGVCYGDATGLDKTGTGTDGCPSMDSGVFNTGTLWGYIDITFSTDRYFYYSVLNSGTSSRPHWVDELTPGSRQPGTVDDVYNDPFGLKIADGHQLLHMGTFIPLYSALDRDPISGSIPFDEYWTNSYSSFHDNLTDNAGTWVNQRNGGTGSQPLVDWVIRNLDSAFASPPASCGEANCVPSQGMYVSHFSSPGCGGTESYYLPYDGYGYNCRTWDGGGQCGTIHRTVTNYSARINGGPCQDLWQSGNTLSDFVYVYRSGAPTSTLAVTRGGTGTGVVSSIPSAINCGNACTATFALGTVVTLNAAAAAGSTFAGWSGAGCSGTGSCTISMSVAQSVTATFNTSGGCGEPSCVANQGMYVSHFSQPGCGGTESYYLPYDGYGYACRSWDGAGQCGIIHRTVTNYSARINGGPCQDLWQSGNTLSDFVTIYR